MKVGTSLLETAETVLDTVKEDLSEAQELLDDVKARYLHYTDQCLGFAFVFIIIISRKRTFYVEFYVKVYLYRFSH